MIASLAGTARCHCPVRHTAVDASALFSDRRRVVANEYIDEHRVDHPQRRNRGPHREVGGVGCRTPHATASGIRQPSVACRTPPAMNFELEIEGVSDHAVTRAIRKRVRMLGQHVDRSEDWRVRLVRSETQREWDLGIRTSSGWQVASFTAPVQQLADIVERRLRVQLALTAAEASAGRT